MPYIMHGVVDCRDVRKANHAENEQTQGHRQKRLTQGAEVLSPDEGGIGKGSSHLSLQGSKLL
jgi:hypothetical protein